MTVEITSPVGRLVGGHPMVSHPVTDDITKLPKMQRDGVTPQIQFYVGIAIPKGVEVHWKDTEWGAKIYAEALASWPNGEHQQPTFSWKIVDGDSQVPNKRMKKPCDREGYPGHWVIHCSNGFAIKSYHLGKYNPMTDLIQQKEAIKTGDYCRVVFSVKSNNSTQTAGMYVNPSLFELYQAGIAIISENEPDAQATLGAVQGQLPTGALVDTNIPAAQPGMAPAAQPGMAPAAQPGMAPAAPAMDFVQGPVDVKYTTSDGGQWTEAQLLQAGYTAQQIAVLPH